MKSPKAAQPTGFNPLKDARSAHSQQTAAPMQRKDWDTFETQPGDASLNRHAFGSRGHFQFPEPPQYEVGFGSQWLCCGIET